MNLADLARLVIRHDDLGARQWAKDARREGWVFAKADAPTELHADELALAAALVELFATRERQAPPTWTQSVRPAMSALFVDPAAATRPTLRARTVANTPAALKRFNVFGPPQYLDVL